jgi:transposase-like protein
MLLLASSVCGLFKWRQFEPEVILLAVGWYLRFSRTYAELLGDKQGQNLLRTTLEEERQTDQKLSELANSAINVAAAAK